MPETVDLQFHNHSFSDPQNDYGLLCILFRCEMTSNAFFLWAVGLLYGPIQLLSTLSFNLSLIALNCMTGRIYCKYHTFTVCFWKCIVTIKFWQFVTQFTYCFIFCPALGQKEKNLTVGIYIMPGTLLAQLGGAMVGKIYNDHCMHIFYILCYWQIII